jgi:P27 family predicted phage terminase small subunit
MAKGRPADPTRARRQTGNRPKPGEAKVAPAPPPAIVTPALPAAPPDLSPEAALMFDRIVAELAPRGLREADLEAVAMMCYSASIHLEARRKIAETGVLVKGPRGPMVNPLVKVARDEAQTYLRLANEFGLTLAARLRLGLMQLAGESIISAMNRDLDEQANTSIVIQVDP